MEMLKSTVILFHLALILCCLLCVQIDCQAQNKNQQRGLLDQTMLHPLDGFTAFTLKKNEFIYNQSPFTLPLPSWAWWGVTDWLSAEIDLLPYVGGFFEKPYLPVPSFNLRFRLSQNENLTIAYETMLQYLYEVVPAIDNDNLKITRRGLSWFHRLNTSIRFAPYFFVHLSGGFTYNNELTFKNKGRDEEIVANFQNSVNPDFSLSLDWRRSNWISFHATGSYGTTFVYIDNIPRKYQLSYGMRIMPLLTSERPFFRNLSIELSGFSIYFPDAKESVNFWIPIGPYVYWQWQS